MVCMMNNSIKKLHFTLHLDQAAKRFSVGVVLDGVEIYHITNFMQLSKRLGYLDITEKIAEQEDAFDGNDALLAESKRIELASVPNVNDFEIASTACFQYKITEYLFENSKLFREKYNEYFTSLVGTCESISIINSAKCVHCYGHPSKITSSTIT